MSKNHFRQGSYEIQGQTVSKIPIERERDADRQKDNQANRKTDKQTQKQIAREVGKDKKQGRNQLPQEDDINTTNV